MIQAFEASGGQATLRAGPWLIIDLNLLGLYTADKKEENTPPGDRWRPFQQDP